MNRIIKIFALFTILFLFGSGFNIDCSAQTKSKRIKKSVAGKRRAAKNTAADLGSASGNSSCSASQNTPRSEVRRTTGTSKGYSISDCEPMNLFALYQPEPVYPKTARAVRASGTVSVDVVIDEAGKVIWAKVVEGHPLLHAEALRMACQTRFKPVVDCLNKRVRSNTIIHYNFKIDE